MVISAARAGAKLGFKPPVPSSIAYRMNKACEDRSPWQRYCDMAGVNKAAQRKAENLLKKSNESKKD